MESFIRQLETPFGFLDQLGVEQSAFGNADSAAGAGEVDPAMAGVQKAVI